MDSGTSPARKRSARKSKGAGGDPPTRAAGFTFIEMILGLVITALIGMAITSMLFATSHGTADAAGMRGLVIQQKLVGTRFDAAIRGASMVLASGANYIVLWMDDSRANGAPDLSELRRIEYDSANHRLISYRMPPSWNQATIDANEVNYTLTADFNAVTNAVKGTSKFPAENWSNSLYGWTVVLDNATVQDAVLVSYRFVVQSGTQQSTIVSAAALRN